MNPLPAENDFDDDPTVLTPEEYAEDLRDIREALADIEQNGSISHEDLMAELSCMTSH
ncbi:MAG: hypothetical protein ABIH23_25725 [bacterium]